MTTEITLFLLFLSIIYIGGQDLRSTGGSIERRCQECGICKLKIESECQAYIQCNSGHPTSKMLCPFGTFFDQMSQNCFRPSNVTCAADPCVINRALKTYPAAEEDSCNLFWKCEDGRSAAGCCDTGFAYDRNLKECIPDKACNKTCSLRGGSHVTPKRPQYQVNVCEGTSQEIRCGAKQEIKINYVNWGRTNNTVCGVVPAGPNCINTVQNIHTDCDRKQSCILRADPALYTDTCPGVPKYLDVIYECREGCYLVVGRNDRRVFYNQERLNATLTCAIGTVFDPTSCVCINSGNPSNVCLLEVHVEFDNTTDKILNKGMNVHLAPMGITKASGFGHFGGRSLIEIPFYAANDNLSKKFGLQLRVFPLHGGPSKQVLLSNCASDKADSASLEIAMMRNVSGTFTVFRVEPSDARKPIVVMELPILMRNWTNILFGYDKKFLYATHQYIDPSTDQKMEDRRKAPFTDKIRISPGPMMIGGCLQKRGNNFIVYNGAHAFLDEIQMSFCKVALPSTVTG